MVLKRLFGFGGGLFSRDRRRDARVLVLGLQARLHGRSESLTVRDLSDGGVCLQTDREEPGRYEPGRTLTLDLVKGGCLVIRGLHARVVRSDDGVVSCEFTQFTRAQAHALRTVCLEAGLPVEAEQRRRPHLARA